MELWDLYNERRELLHQDHVRGQALPPGAYHLVVHIWIQNSNGQFLMSQRAADRAHDALKWECTGGSVLKGENSYAGAIREVREELGIDLSAVAGELVFSEVRERMHGVRFADILDVYRFHYNKEADLRHAEPREVAQTKWMTTEQIRALYDNGEMVGSLYYFFDKIALPAQ